jgi:hypothetical protein
MGIVLTEHELQSELKSPSMTKLTVTLGKMGIENISCHLTEC